MKRRSDKEKAESEIGKDENRSSCVIMRRGLDYERKFSSSLPCAEKYKQNCATEN